MSGKQPAQQFNGAQYNNGVAQQGNGNIGKIGRQQNNQGPGFQGGQQHFDSPIVGGRGNQAARDGARQMQQNAPNNNGAVKQNMGNMG